MVADHKRVLLEVLQVSWAGGINIMRGKVSDTDHQRAQGSNPYSSIVKLFQRHAQIQSASLGNSLGGDPKVEIGDEELPSSFHTSSSTTSSSAIEATEAIVEHVMLPLIWKLFRLQQMKENAPADFRIPLPLSITESTRLGVGASRGSTSNRARVLSSPKRVPNVPCPPHHYKQVLSVPHGAGSAASNSKSSAADSKTPSASTSAAA
ncbi:hypothetical protein INR49_011275 [Caranx melampygus]|nr:hypothetical protein INR49_011275 [Caranx melampygus]